MGYALACCGGVVPWDVEARTHKFKTNQKGEAKVKLKLISALVAGLLSAAPSFANSVTLDFEGATSYGSINNFYNGGTDLPSTNVTPASGVNYGISFGLDALALSNDELGPYFSNAPTPGTVLSVVGGDAAMNSLSGFTGQVSFSYSSSAETTVGVYSGLNGTGTLLDSFTLTANATNGCSDTSFCHWDLTTLNLGSSVAQSIQFANIAGVAAVDNVSVNAVPLPAAAWMLVSALGSLGVVRRKRAA